VNYCFRKVKCLVDTAKSIIQCVNTYWKGKIEEEKLIVGGDELLPLFTYVVIKAGVSFLYIESCFVESFISESAAKEQGGYLVATFQTCLSFIACLNKNQLEESAKQIFEKNLVQEKQQKEIQKVIEEKKHFDKTGSMTLTELEQSLETPELQEDSLGVDESDKLHTSGEQNSFENQSSTSFDLISFD